MKWEPTHLDFTRSPYTGLTRDSWLDAAKYLLSGIFQYIDDIDQPVVVPRQETVITYPHPNSPAELRQAEERAEIFEGLARSFFIAAPLIHHDPEVTVAGIKLRDYYRRQVLRTCTPGDPYCAGTYDQLWEMAAKGDMFRPFQQTVETCALVICLWVCREEIWAAYSQAERDTIAHFLLSFAHAPTVPQNWRLFNMLDMAFLHNEGYKIDTRVMHDHAQAILEYYAGDGWYRDGQCFDYYSCWAFQFYAPLWNRWYGYDHEPYLASKFEEYSNRLMESYPDFFDRDGYTNMWGRSNIYRFAAVSAFDGNFYLNHPTANPGLARRISSGSLLQFLTREDFLWQGLPTMGFYRQFSPLVQGYSCAESPFWMGKAFLCLHLPENHPFWTATEEPGSWGALQPGQVKETVLDGPGLAFSNHGSTGETILRTGKVVKAQNDFHGMWNYGKLSYNTKFPWESTPEMEPLFGRTDLQKGDVESQQYVLKDLTGHYRSLANVTFWAGQLDGVLYRKQIFDYNTHVEGHWMQSLYLADFPVGSGLMRVDKLKLFRRPVILTLGSYGFPHHDTQVTQMEQGSARAVILKGYDAMGRARQLAFTVFAGFSELGCLRSRGSSPDSEESLVVYGSASLQNQYDGGEAYVFISQTLTRESHAPFTEEELFPIAKIDYTDPYRSGVYGPVTLHFKDGSRKTVDFNGMEGRLSL